MADDLNEYDKKIEPGKRTTFHVHLEQGVSVDKSQVVPFGCVLKKISIYLTSACDWLSIVDVSIDEKVIVRVRGKQKKIEYELEEPIYSNSTVNFMMSNVQGSAKAQIFGEIEITEIGPIIQSYSSRPTHRASPPSISKPDVTRPGIAHAPSASSEDQPSNGQSEGRIPFPRYPPNDTLRNRSRMQK